MKAKDVAAKVREIRDEKLKRKMRRKKQRKRERIPKNEMQMPMNPLAMKMLGLAWLWD